MSRRDDRTLLRDMLDYAEMALAAARGKQRSDLDEDFVLRGALERFVEVIGEAAGKVSLETQAQCPGIPWPDVTGMRHKLIHGYASVDRDILWAVVQEDLPGLISDLRAALAAPES